MFKATKQPTSDPDHCAALAEAAFQELCKIGRRQIEAALKAGALMASAKTQLGHGKFGAAFRRWREEALITFSDRSARRWMLLAKHGDAIKSANLANLHEAEQLAQQIENGLGANAEPEKRPGKAKSLTCTDAVSEFEHRLLCTLRKLTVDEQREFLSKAFAIVQRRFNEVT